MSREITQKIDIDKDAETIFNTLLKPSAIIEWWEVKIAIVIKENNGFFALSWGENIDDPDYVTVSKIENLIPNKEFSLKYLSYNAKTGKLPFLAKLKVKFIISLINNTKSTLKIKHTGIPDNQIADEYFEGCKKGWNLILKNIKKYCEEKI